MKRMPFQRPTEYYDERIETTDEQICELLKQRKELSTNNPGFPTEELIAKWSTKYNFYEDFLRSIFSHLLNEEQYKPVVEPRGFLANIPVLKSHEKDGAFYTVTFVRQFQNASVVNLTIDREDSDRVSSQEEHSFFDLMVESGAGEYDCRNNFGGGSRTHYSFTFTVSPALPDDLSDIKFVFKEVSLPFSKTTGYQFVIQPED
ncbi:hypothetical protein [Halobacillus salinus]|uniref:hypothetical protein n=1 Tax=Halobacillus salinus TaxID=192814 RepID=UPI0009A85B17|nr:hypothetical protein [Halobacillus salinus]